MYSDFADVGLDGRDGPEITLQQLERVASLAMAGGLVLNGIGRRNVTGLGLAVAAVPLIYRGALGQWPTVTSSDVQGTRGQLAGEGGLVVQEAVRLELPLDQVIGWQPWPGGDITVADDWRRSPSSQAAPRSRRSGYAPSSGSMS